MTMSDFMQNNFIRERVIPLIRDVVDPHTGQPLLVLEAISDIQQAKNKLIISITLGYPSADVQQLLSEQLWASLTVLDEVDAIEVDLGWRAPTNVVIDNQPLLAKVANIVAVASGKGGVGKSTTTVNLALAMAALGARVGIVDADIYGPSQPQMLGVGSQRPEVREQKMMLPIEAHGVKSMSMGYLVNERTPMVWRGPMASGALQQLLFQTDWQDLDYLFVDMPPGTGDIQLTLSQQVPVSAAVIVTTPQDIALLDAKKAIEMFTKVNVPISGIVENMAVHQCSQCGHSEHIFGEGGGERIAQDYGVPLLGALPLALSIREQADSGQPTVVSEPEGDVTEQYKAIARRIAVGLWQQHLQAAAAPTIVVTDD